MALKEKLALHQHYQNEQKPFEPTLLNLAVLYDCQQLATPVNMQQST